MKYNNLKITLGKRVFSKKDYDITINKKVIIIESLNGKNEYIYDRETYSIFIDEYAFIVYRTTKIKLHGKVEPCGNDTYKIVGIVESYNASDFPYEFKLKKAEPINEGLYIHFLYVEFMYQGALNIEIE